MDAFLENNTGYLNLFDELPDKSTYRVFIEISDNDFFDNYDIHFSYSLPGLLGYYYTLLEGGNYNLFPVTKILYNISLHIYIFLLVIFNLIRKKQYSLLGPYSILFGLFITTLLGPVSILRYVLPIVLLTPINIMLLFDKKRTLN